MTQDAIIRACVQYANNAAPYRELAQLSRRQEGRFIDLAPRLAHEDNAAAYAGLRLERWRACDPHKLSLGIPSLSQREMEFFECES